MTSRQAKLQEDTYFRVMRILQENPDITQREDEKLRQLQEQVWLRLCTHPNWHGGKSRYYPTIPAAQDG